MTGNSNRSCIVCNGYNGDQILDEHWDVVGLGRIQIGFKLCNQCGTVFQDPLVPREIMLQHYSAFSNYTNPGRAGKPAESKIRNVERQVNTLKKHTSTTGSLLQIGCSDGYTLSEFKNAGWEVEGVDPSENALKLANERYGINGYVGDFESVSENLGKYDAIVATHVLEHIYEPNTFLQKIAEHLHPDGLALIEVPCLKYPESWPNGYFTFEHVNYYSEKTLSKALQAAGFEIEEIEITNEWVSSTVVCVVAKFTNRKVMEANSSIVQETKEAINSYMNWEKNKGWGRIEQTITPKLREHKSICIWGAGIHTSQLLAKTSLDTLAITGIVDMDTQKRGHSLKGIEVAHPHSYDWSSTDAIVISTYSNEQEVYTSTQKLRKQGIKVYCLYDAI